MKLVSSFSLLLVLSAAAVAQPCNPSQDVVVTVTPQVALPGQQITVKAANVSTGCIYIQGSGCVFGAVRKVDCTGPGVTLLACTSILQFVGPGGSNSQVWDQTDGMGKQVPPGQYAFELTWKDANGKSLGLCPTVLISNCLPGQPYGTASTGTGGIEPLCSTNGLPQVGNGGFQIDVSQGLGGAPMLLFLGVAQAQIPAPWGDLLIDPNQPFFQIPLSLGGAAGVPGAGSVTLAAPIPNNPVLAGLSPFFQVLIGDQGSTGGIAHTKGLTFKVCS